MTNIFLDTALKLHDIGLRIIPIKPNLKTPFASWEKYQHAQTKANVQAEFKAHVSRMALLCTNGIECIDVDIKNHPEPKELERELLTAICNRLGLDLYNKLVINRTPSGGLHIIYKSPIEEGGAKLAGRADSSTPAKPLYYIETRGKGNYILIPPSNGYTSKRNDISNIPTITAEARHAIISICKSLNTYDNPKHHVKQDRAVLSQISAYKDNPIDLYQSSVSAADILENNGWTYSHDSQGLKQYTRPNKSVKDGVSATYFPASNTVNIFTSNSDLEQAGYNAFQLYAHYEHAGNQSAAVLQICKDNGIQDNNAPQPKTTIDKANKTPQSKLDEMFKSCLFTVNTPPPNIEYKFRLNGQEVATYGDIITIVGAAKSGKTALVSSIVASALSSAKKIAHVSTTVDGRNIVYFDCEQNGQDLYKVNNRLLRAAGLPENKDVPQLKVFQLTDRPLIERVAFIEYAIKKIGNVGLVVLDGIVDLIRDYNDQTECRDLLEKLKLLTAQENFMLCNILHVSKSTDRARGHIGTELENKSKAIIQTTALSDDILNGTTISVTHLRGNRAPANCIFTYAENGDIE